jgi:hypothetical protein
MEDLNYDFFVIEAFDDSKNDIVFYRVDKDKKIPWFMFRPLSDGLFMQSLDTDYRKYGSIKMDMVNTEHFLISLYKMYVLNTAGLTTKECICTNVLDPKSDYSYSLKIFPSPLYLTFSLLGFCEEGLNNAKLLHIDLCLYKIASTSQLSFKDAITYLLRAYKDLEIYKLNKN